MADVEETIDTDDQDLVFVCCVAFASIYDHPLVVYAVAVVPHFYLRYSLKSQLHLLPHHHLLHHP